MISRFPPHDPSIPDDIALAAGRFLAAASMMDSLLEHLVWYLLGNDPAELRPLTWHLGVGKKREAIQHLLSKRGASAEVLGAWEKAKPLISTVSENRNWVAHGVWWHFPAGYIRTHKGTYGTLKTIDSNDLKQWTKDAREAIVHLEQLFAVPAPSLGKP